MHGSPLARELAIPRLLIPPTPGILCALGMLVADLRHDLVQTRLAAHRDLSPEAARAVFEPMLAEARRLLDADRVPPDRQRIEMQARHALCRAVLRAADPGRRLLAGGMGGAGADVSRRARKPLRPQRPDAPVEIVSFGVTATGLIETPELPRPSRGEAEPPEDARSGARRAYFEAVKGRSGGWAECPVWRREALLAGNETRRAGDCRGNFRHDGALSGRPRPRR